MGTTLSPAQLALTIVGVTAVIGLIVFFVRRRSLYAGYEEYEGEARSLAHLLGGELFRDGGDLVVFGNYQTLPTQVRFSNSDVTPGLQMRVQAPATFPLTVAPVAVTDLPGRVVARANDPQFDTRFTIRSEQPLDARLFLSPPTLLTIRKLCCS